MSIQHDRRLHAIAEAPPGSRFAGRLAVGLLALFALLYLFTGLRVSATRPLWMDEVLAVWTSRFASPAEIWHAVAHGAEFSPPTYHILLHGLTALAGGSWLVMRLPGLLAALGCGAAVFVLVRRRFAVAFAALAAALTLELALYNFAVQARPYLLVTFCLALALLAWDRAGQTVAVWRACLIAAALSLAIALHFYAALLTGVLAGMEALRLLASRQWRPRIWVALAVPVLSLAAWVPLMRQILRYNAGDTGAAHYFARPSLGLLLSSYGDLMLGPNDALLIGFAFIMAAALLARHFVPRRWERAAADTAPGADADRDLDFDVATACTVALPLVVFAASLLVTRTFNERYALGAALGVAMLYARLVARMPGGPWVACGLLATSCVLWGIHARKAAAPSVNPDLALIERASGDLPIVVGEGLHFLQLDELAPPDLRRRLVFLSMPGAPSSDPTDAHQVERWAPLRADLPITTLDRFVANHPSFYLFSSAEQKDTVTNHFLATGEISGVVGNAIADGGESWLFSVHVRR